MTITKPPVTFCVQNPVTNHVKPSVVHKIIPQPMVPKVVEEVARPSTSPDIPISRPTDNGKGKEIVIYNPFNALMIDEDCVGEDIIDYSHQGPKQTLQLVLHDECECLERERSQPSRRSSGGEGFDQ
ncbi:UNVERIFIED_CONTAM: hypothetical protein Sradi_4876300 [Sesamum radiatum]|uniref:Uncharacterized protein n=1 Tax=Sesamum radiatum TaxID=300843 RepID=A0AAW2MYS8_SESRA